MNHQASAFDPAGSGGPCEEYKPLSYRGRLELPCSWARMLVLYVSMTKNVHIYTTIIITIIIIIIMELWNYGIRSSKTIVRMVSWGFIPNSSLHGPSG